MRLARLSFATSAALVGLAGGASAAQAADLCVGAAPASVTCATSYPFDATGLSQALSAANLSNAADNVYVAPGTITLPSAVSWTAGAADSLIGAGTTTTTLRTTANGDAFGISGGGTIPSITNLRLEGARTGNTTSGSLLRLQAGVIADNLVITDLSEASDNTTAGVVFGSGATLRNSSLTVNSQNAIAAIGTNGPLNLTDVTLGGSGYAAILQSFLAGSDPSRFTRLRVNPGFYYGLTADSGAFQVTDSLFDLGTLSGAIGFSIANFNNGSNPNTLTLTRSTVIGSGNTQTGVYANSNSPGENVTVSVTDTLLDFGTGASSLGYQCLFTAGAMSFTLDHVGTNGGTDNGCALQNSSPLDLITKPAIYRNRAAGDYRPTIASPVVDAGTVPGNGKPGTDLASMLRGVDGDGDGTPKMDIGAYEYQRVAPTQPTLTATPTSAKPGETVNLTASGSTDADGESFTYAWSFGDGGTATGAAASHAFASAGTYTVSLTATDTTGKTSTPATAVITVAAPQQPGTTALTPLLKLTKAPKAKSKRTAKGFALAAKPSKTTATLSLTNATSLKLSLASVKSKKTKALPGTATLKVSGATVNLAFGGTWNAKKLGAGTYTVTVTPISSTGTAGTPVAYTLTLK